MTKLDREIENGRHLFFLFVRHLADVNLFRPFGTGKSRELARAHEERFVPLIVDWQRKKKGRNK